MQFGPTVSNALVFGYSLEHQVIDFGDDGDGDEVFDDVDYVVRVQRQEHVHDEACISTSELEEADQHRVLEALLLERVHVLFGEAQHVLGDAHLWQKNDMQQKGADDASHVQRGIADDDVFEQALVHHAADHWISFVRECPYQQPK